MQYPWGRAAVVVVVLALSTPAWAQSVSGLLQKGIYAEETVGDLDAAIKLYEQIVAAAEANQAHVAQAHYRLGMCYLKKGQKPEAVAAFQKLVEQFPKETELVAQARARLSTLGQPSAGVVVRQVWADAEAWSGVPSPDGKYLCYVDWQNWEVGVRELATGKNRRLINQSWPEYGNHPIFSPDSKQVAYCWTNKEGLLDLRIVGLDGSDARVVYPNKDKEVGLATHDWSADGKHILATFSKKGTIQIVLVSVTDGSVRVLKTLDRRPERKMSLSPDGRYVAYTSRQQKDAPQRDIFLLATNDRSEIPLVAHPADDHVLGWAPDGQRLVFASDRTGSWGVWLIAVADGKPQGSPELLKPEMGQFHAMGLTRSGSFYYGILSGGQNVYTATLDLEKGKLLTAPVEAMQRAEGFNWAPAWSPDGRFLACLSYNLRTAPRFYIRSVESHEVRDLIPKLKGINIYSLHWSPDGKALVGAGRPEEGRWAVLRVDVQTGAVTTLKLSGLFPFLDPDGKALFFSSVSGDPRRLFRRDLQTGVDQELYRSPLSDQARFWTLSPDGLQLAFAQGGALKLLPATGGEPRELTKGEGSLSTVAWMPDGRHLLFQRLIGPEGNVRSELWRVPSAGGEPQKLELNLPSMGHLRVHPDGRQIAFTAYSSQAAKSEIWVMENFLPPPKAAP